jgi:hypothetical protein
LQVRVRLSGALDAISVTVPLWQSLRYDEGATRHIGRQRMEKNGLANLEFVLGHRANP